MERKILIIAGPTAVGKTEYSIEAAEAVNGEIVSADSMQLYKFMDIGSAKPTSEERAAVPHHLIDEIDPRIPFSVFEYRKRALSAIEDIFSRGKVPVIAGGTGLYVNSLIYDMDFSEKPDDDSLRKKLHKIYEEEGSMALHQILKEKDPEAAERIHPNNVKKVIRAIEILDSGSDRVKTFEESFVKTDSYSVRLAVLNRKREELYDRINRRVDILVKEGLIEEVSGLKKMGLTAEDISMKGIGYKEVLAYLDGEYDFDEAIRLIKRNTRRYAKRQLTWFRRYDEARWFNLSDSLSKETTVSDVVNFFRS